MPEIVNNIKPPMDLPFLPKIDWEEAVDNRSPGSDSFSFTDATAVLVGYIPWKSRYAAMVNILGYSFVTGVIGSGQSYLWRVPPMTHPYWPNMYATAITDVQGVRFAGRRLQSWSRKRVGDLSSYAEYEKARITVQFNTLPYRVVGGAPETEPEYSRYVSMQVEPFEESLVGTLGAMKYAEGAPGTATQSFPQTVGVIWGKQMLKLKWHQVPAEYLSDIPTHTIAAPDYFASYMSKVNFSEFLGYPAGTLRFRPPIMTRYPSPLTDETGNQKFYYDIEFHFEYFRPTKGVPESVYEGHNLLPWQKDGLFYYATRQPSGLPIFQSANFATLFRYRGIP